MKETSRSKSSCQDSIPFCVTWASLNTLLETLVCTRYCKYPANTQVLGIMILCFWFSFILFLSLYHSSYNMLCQTIDTIVGEFISIKLNLNLPITTGEETYPNTDECKSHFPSFDDYWLTWLAESFNLFSQSKIRGMEERVRSIQTNWRYLYFCFYLSWVWLTKTTTSIPRTIFQKLRKRIDKQRKKVKKRARKDRTRKTTKRKK